MMHRAPVAQEPNDATTPTTRSLREWITEHQLTAKVFQVESRPDGLMGDLAADATHWRVRLHMGGRQMTLYFSQGPAIPHPPTVEGVVDCLASDFSTTDQSDDFEGWCDELGYDADSRKAERIYRACERQANQFVRLLGGRGVAADLAYNVERL